MSYLLVGKLIEILQQLPSHATARAYEGEGRRLIVIEVTDKWHQAKEIASIDCDTASITLTEET